MLNSNNDMHYNGTYSSVFDLASVLKLENVWNLGMHRQQVREGRGVHEGAPWQRARAHLSESHRGLHAWVHQVGHQWADSLGQPADGRRGHALDLQWRDLQLD